MKHDPNKKAVCCVVARGGGKVLSVSRKYDSNLIGLPGGKIDPGETMEEACLRELKEETGLDGEIIRHLHSGYEVDYLTHCFLVDAPGEFESVEDGVVRESEVEDLVNKETCPFSEYNMQVFTKLHDIFRNGDLWGWQGFDWEEKENPIMQAVSGDRFEQTPDVLFANDNAQLMAA